MPASLASPDLEGSEVAGVDWRLHCTWRTVPGPFWPLRGHCGGGEIPPGFPDHGRKSSRIPLSRVSLPKAQPLLSPEVSLHLRVDPPSPALW